MKSKSHFDTPQLLSEDGFITTEEDVTVLRRLRREASNVSLDDLSIFNSFRFLSVSIRERSTSEGWEPFEL